MTRDLNPNLPVRWGRPLLKDVIIHHWPTAATAVIRQRAHILWAAAGGTGEGDCAGEDSSFLCLLFFWQFFLNCIPTYLIAGVFFPIFLKKKYPGGLSVAAYLIASETCLGWWWISALDINTFYSFFFFLFSEFFWMSCLMVNFISIWRHFSNSTRCICICVYAPCRP